jgi:NtrC-family two-component system sensor histidine kinase KinB
MRATQIPFLDATKGSLELLEKLQEGIWIADNSERIVFANRALGRLVGSDGPEALAGRPWREILPEGEAARLLRSSPGNGSCAVAESTLLVSGDRRLPVTIALFPRSADDGVWYVGSVVPSPTPKSRDTAGESALPAERVRTDFMAMVSHDLRTPLAAIKEALSLLSETAAGRLDERQHRYLTIAREEVDRLNRMIDNVIEVSRMGSGKAVLHTDAVDLPELLSTAIQSLSLIVSKRGLAVERNIPSHLPPVSGDRDRLLRVFNNLLDNAIKYSPPGGTIRVDIGFVDPGSSVLTQGGVLADSDYLEITVSDDGPGIPAEFLDRIFGKFERVEPHGPGIGLGLAIVRSIVEMHHGKVWAESRSGDGAKLHFILPIKENS